MVDHWSTDGKRKKACAMTSPRLPSAPDNIFSPRESAHRVPDGALSDGPNLLSLFHVIGEHLDRVYELASLTSPLLTTVQTTLVPPGGATVIELKLEAHSASLLNQGCLGPTKATRTVCGQVREKTALGLL